MKFDSIWGGLYPLSNPKLSPLTFQNRASSISAPTHLEFTSTRLGTRSSSKGGVDAHLWPYSKTPTRLALSPSLDLTSRQHRTVDRLDRHPRNFVKSRHNSEPTWPAAPRPVGRFMYCVTPPRFTNRDAPVPLPLMAKARYTTQRSAPLSDRHTVNTATPGQR